MGPVVSIRYMVSFYKIIINMLSFFNKQVIVVNFYNKPISVGKVLTICCCTFLSLLFVPHLLLLISPYFSANNKIFKRLKLLTVLEYIHMETQFSQIRRNLSEFARIVGVVRAV